MKKLLISLTILFSIFIGINSVSAYTTATYHSTSDDWVYINTLNMTQEEINVYSKQYVSYNTSATETAIKRILAAREYYNNYYSDKYSYYIITADMAQSSPWIYLFVFNEFPYSSYYLEAPYIVNGTGYLNYNSIHFRFDNSDTSLYKLFYTSNGTKFSERPSYENNVLILNNSSSSSLKYLSNYYETNYSFDVRLNPNKGTGTAYYDVFYYDNKVYQNGDILFNTLEKNNMNIVKENKPKIKMSLLEQQENFMKININFSTFNTDKYIYYYSTDRKNWVDILENDYKYTSYINGTLYVMILDKQEFIESVESGNIVYNPLATATYTFSNINEVIPELKFNLNVSDNCKIRKNTEEIIVCKNLDIEIINYNSIDKYIWQYSFDRENWLNIYTNKFNVEFSENKTIYFKLLDKINNEELKYVTYTVTGINAIPGDIGAYIKMKGSYNKDSFSYEIDTYFYNYDSSLYNYYYSKDGINWNEISSYNMLATTNSSIKHIILKFYKDLTVYVKIENKNNEYVNAATYTITYFSNNDSLKDSLDLFSSKSYLTGQAFQNFSEIWNKFKQDTGIYTYLLMVVLSSIALLLIKSFRK